LSVSDLAELITSFNDVTARLQSTHETLRGEVTRLEAELRDAKEQLHRAQELAALGEMAAGIAHEVRNPLGSIRLYASALAQDLSDRPAERELATKIAGSVSRLDAVVGDVLTFARRMVVREEEVPTGKLIDDALDACAALFERHAIVLHRPRRRELFVRGDAVLLHQALVNVIRNAAEAMGEAGCVSERAIWIEARRTRSVTAEGGAALQQVTVLSVRDNGPGIPEDVLSRVFNPFFTTRHTGTGLGLAIVHRIIDAHKGRVVIRSNAAAATGPSSTGTTVEFHLPSPAAATAVISQTNHQQHVHQQEAA
jgi:signal transduction histidine kinase